MADECFTEGLAGIEREVITGTHQKILHRWLETRRR